MLYGPLGPHEQSVAQYMPRYYRPILHVFPSYPHGTRTVIGKARCDRHTGSESSRRLIITDDMLGYSSRPLGLTGRLGHPL